MNIVGLLFNQIVIMFILIGIGFIFYKIGFISNEGSKNIAKILLYLVVPIVIIKNFILEKTSENIEILIHASIISLIAMLIAIIVSYIFFGRKDGIANFSSTFSNAGFIGIPLVEAVIGEKAVFYISIMIVLINALQWTYGVFMISGDKSVINPKKIITNPIVISVVIGLIIFFTQLQIPQIVTTVFNSISGLNTPLAMILSGVYLAQADIKKSFKKLAIYKVSLIRLIIVPLITLFVFRFLPFGDLDVKMAILIAAACPVGSNVAIFASIYDNDYISAVEHVCMTTLLCLLSLPFITYLASIIL